jgi:predicted permease
VIEGLNALAGSAFVALILAMVGCIFLWRLIAQLLMKIDKQWEIIGTLAAGLKDNNAITERALEMAARSGRSARA